MASRLKWFSTDTGRKFSMAVALGSAMSAFSIQFTPHNILVDRYRDLLQLYKFGNVVPVPDDLVSKAKQVQEEMNLKPKYRDLINYFTIYGFDISHIGSTNFKTGVYLGLPVNFSYKTVDDIDRKNIIIRNKHIDWTKPEALALQSSLILSESAQKFAMARELYMSTTNQIMVHSFINLSGVATCYNLAVVFNQKTDAFKKAFSFRCTAYTLIGLFSLTLWAFLRDAATVYYEEWADKTASLLGNEYARGAVEFYTKILQRNVALRALLGEDVGPKYYTAFGNDHTLFRTPHMPFTARRDAAILRYEALAAEKGQSPVPEVVTV